MTIEDQFQKYTVISTNGTTCMDAGARVMPGAIAEKSYGRQQLPLIEMTDSKCPKNAMNQSFNASRQHGFSYIEVLVASFLVAIALVPAMDAMKTGILSVDVHQDLTERHYSRLKKMEELQAEPFSNLLNAAKVAVNSSTASNYSDAAGASNRNLVYIALYDADVDPFTITDPNQDADNDPYTGNTANLLWVQVVTEGDPHDLKTLIRR